MGANAYLDNSVRGSIPHSKNEFASTAVGSQYDSVYEEWPELHDKLTKMHEKKAQNPNFSEEVLSNLISQS